MEKNIDSRRRRRRQLNWLRLRANPNPIYALHNCPRRRKRRRSRGRTQLVGRSVGPAVGHIRQSEQKRSDKFWRAEIWVTKRKLTGRTDGRTNRWPHFSLSLSPVSLSLFPNRRCQFSSWYLTLSDAFLVHRAVSPSPCPPPPQSIRCDITHAAGGLLGGRQNALPNQPPVPLRANKYRRAGGGESY